MSNTTKMNKKFMEGIEKCAALYGFKVEDAIAKIIESKKKVKIVAPKSLFALPFSGEKNEKCCEGLRYNEGLYTQCEVVKKGDNKYCAVCEKGELKYGTIEGRMSVGVMEYKDPSGKSPVHYSKIMKKLKLTDEAVLEEALKMGKKVDPIHLVAQEEKRGRPKAVKVVKEKEEKKKGRPKKAPKGLELESKTTDLFASLIANSVESSSEIDDMCEAEFVKKSEENDVNELVTDPVVVKECSKAVEKDLKEELKALEKAEKAEKDQVKALEKAKKEQEKALEKVKKEEEKALKEQEKALKEQEKAAKKAPKEKVVKEKVVKEKVVKEKVVKKDKVEEKVEEKASEEEEEEEADVVKKIKFEGATYLKSKKSGIVYNMEQDVIGKWDEANQKITFNQPDAELEEDECDSDSE